MDLLQERVDSGIEQEGSNLSGVSSRCSWEETGDSDNLHTGVHEEDKENKFIDGDRRGSNEVERPHISEYGSLCDKLTYHDTFKQGWLRLKT